MNPGCAKHEGMNPPSFLEMAAVTAVGLALAAAAGALPQTAARPLAVGAGLYVLGYFVATKRPSGGYGQLSR